MSLKHPQEADDGCLHLNEKLALETKSENDLSANPIKLAPYLTGSEYSTESLEDTKSVPQADTSVHDAHYKRALRKIDVRVILILSISSFLLCITRTSFPNALVMNDDDENGSMKDQLDITDKRYSYIVMILTAVSIVFELPSNLLLKYISPRFHITRLAIGWGIVTICGAAATNFQGIVANKILLAIAQAGFFPSVFYIFGLWYTEEQKAFRVAIYFNGLILSGAFSGLIGTACSYLNNKGHLTGWRWLFILTGIPSVLIGIVAFFLLPNSPETATFLSEEERDVIIKGLKVSQIKNTSSDASNESTKLSFNDIWIVFKDSTFWFLTIMYILMVMASIPVSQFLPLLIEGLGFHGVNIQLMTIPVSIFTLICSMISGWGSDRFRNRPLFIIIGLSLVAIGYLMLGLIKTNIAGRMIALYLTSLGPVSEIPMVVYVLKLQQDKGWSSSSFKFGSSAILALASAGGITAPLVMESGLTKENVSYAFFAFTMFSVLQGLICWWLYGSGVDDKTIAKPTVEHK
ncbi:MFS general substrate transporter [Wallemia mellicola]|uniref:MFS general substrate transporter n=1 Tax=Wallemia mellicola TaxID=1708541 RepID=A0A4T0RBV4_9BASI|nr:MFS general substrate transporter [Wallemia mellicola]